MLGRLRQLLPPPADPVEPAWPAGWAEVEGALGTELPSDFNAAGIRSRLRPRRISRTGRLLHRPTAPNPVCRLAP